MEQCEHNGRKRQGKAHAKSPIYQDHAHGGTVTDADADEGAHVRRFQRAQDQVEGRPKQFTPTACQNETPSMPRAHTTRYRPAPDVST